MGELYQHKLKEEIYEAVEYDSIHQLVLLKPFSKPDGLSFYTSGHNFFDFYKYYTKPQIIDDTKDKFKRFYDQQ